MKTTRLFSNREHWAPVLAVVSLAVGMASASAQLTITVGNFDLPENTLVTVPIELKVSNDGSAPAIGGLDFVIEIAGAGPKIKSVDLLTGTIFENNNDAGQVQAGGSPDTDHIQFWGVARSQSKPAPTLSTGLNRIGFLTFDTTGIAPGEYALKLKDTFFGDTVYGNVSSSPIGLIINNGSLTVVPEPSSALVVGGLLIGLAGVLKLKKSQTVD